MQLASASISPLNDRLISMKHGGGCSLTVVEKRASEFARVTWSVEHTLLRLGAYALLMHAMANTNTYTVEGSPRPRPELSPNRDRQVACV